MVTMAQAIQALAPGAQFSLFGEDYNSLVWLSPEIPVPTYDQVQDEITTLTLQQPFNECAATAQKLLDQSDWATKSDVTDTSLTPHLVNSAEFTTYRLALRSLRINPQQNPVWPVKPTEIWSS